MIINKITDTTTGKSKFYFVIKKDFIKDTKNPNYVKVVLDENWTITTDNQNTVALKDLIKSELLPVNTFKNK